MQLEFEAHLQAVAAQDLGVVDLGIVDQRVLVLRIAALAAELGEAADRRADETTREGWIERLVGDREAGSRLADRGRELAVVAVVAAEPEFEDGCGADRPGEAADALVGLNVDVAVGVAARGAGNIRRAEDAGIELAVAARKR